MGHTEYTDDETYKLIHGTYPSRDDEHPEDEQSADDNNDGDKSPE